MKQELEDELLEYLGELTYDYENFEKNSCIDKYATRDKIKAIHTLLELEYVEYNSTKKALIEWLSKPR